jgi:hypothetical protein
MAVVLLPTPPFALVIATLRIVRALPIDRQPSSAHATVPVFETYRTNLGSK